MNKFPKVHTIEASELFQEITFYNKLEVDAFIEELKKQLNQIVNQMAVFDSEEIILKHIGRQELSLEILELFKE